MVEKLAAIAESETLVVGMERPATATSIRNESKLQSQYMDNDASCRRDDLPVSPEPPAEPSNPL